MTPYNPMSAAGRNTFSRRARSAALRAARSVVERLDRRFGDGPPGTKRRQDSPDGPLAVYESLYDAHAESEGDLTVVGDITLGRVELEILQQHGLQPDHTLLDFGCGIGRLACEVVPWLGPAMPTSEPIYRS